MDKTLELLKKVGSYMQDDPRYNFDQPEYHTSKEFRKVSEKSAAQFKRQQLEKSRNAYKKAKEKGTIKVL